GPFSINTHLMPEMPFDPTRDIAPVAMLAVTPLLLVVHPSVPARNLPELLAWLRAQKGAATYASQAAASTGDLPMELMKSRTRVEATHVPYRGSAAQAATDLLAGRVSMGFISTSTTLPHVASGRLRAIGVAELKRLRAAPDIPTLDESGLPGFEATRWLGLGTRAGTRQEIVNLLAERSAQALARPEVEKRMASLGIEPRPLAPREFAAFLRADSAKWADIIRRSGAKLEEPMAKDPPRLSAVELARLIRTRKLSPVEVAEAHLAAIARVNPAVNAFCTVVPEKTLAWARHAEAVVKKRGKLGPLHGVPVAIKDLTATADIRTTFGPTLFRDHGPTEDAEVVRRLKAAGAVVLGKTNTPEFGAGANTFNKVFGATRNPWNTALSASGSTGGGAAALAARIAPLAE